MFARILILALAAAVVTALPAQVKDTARTSSIWKGTPLEDIVDDLNKDCKKDMDSIACLKYKLFNLVDDVLRKDSFKVSDSMAVIRNSRPASGEARGEASLLESAQNYILSHDVLLQVPSTVLEDATLRLSPRRLDQDELSLSLQFDQGRAPGVEEGRKSKLKKILIPILVFVMLKALTLIPLFIGVLGLKAWNALQLSFFSFVISVGLAIFQLCKKIAADATPQISAHSAWDPHYGRSLEPQALAYRAHVQDS